MSTKVFYGVDNPTSINKPQSASNSSEDKSATQVALSTPQPVPQPSTHPVTQIVQTLQNVKTDTPEAKLNKDSMVDASGKRITFNDEETRSKTFKGIEDPSRLPIKKK